jgi:hypothetical protein
VIQGGALVSAGFPANLTSAGVDPYHCPTFGDGRAPRERAHAKIKRLLARLELVLTQITELERERDAVVETEASDKASNNKMIQQLTGLRGIGVGACVLPVGLPSEPCRGEAGRADSTSASPSLSWRRS